MSTLGPSPFVWLQFDETGVLKDNAGADPRAELAAALTAPGITDLVVISHGWQNDLPNALNLYTTLWQNSCDPLQASGWKPETIVVAGILWPAKKFDANMMGHRPWLPPKTQPARSPSPKPARLPVMSTTRLLRTA